MLQVDPSRRIDIDATAIHPWTQTGANDAPGLPYELCDIWGVLKAVGLRDGHAVSSCWPDLSDIRLYGEHIVIGRGRSSYIQIPDDRISAQHCTIVLKDSRVYLSNTGRSSCWVNDRPLAKGQTVPLKSPDVFHLCAPSPNTGAKDGSDRRPRHSFRVEMLNKPWTQIWVTSQHELSKASISDFAPVNTVESSSSSEQQRQAGKALNLGLASPPLSMLSPPLILPVQSAHLSHLPFGGAKNAYVVDGRLLLDPGDRELADALRPVDKLQQLPWIVLGVLSGDYPRLHIYDQTTVFGRSSDCAVCFDDAHISMQHCTIDRCSASGSALLTNHSSNGTFVNSQRVEGTTALNKGDDLVLLFDRIDGTLCEKTLLGQQQAFDCNGYPVLVGYRIVSLCGVRGEQKLAC
ncbi:hypothetical protein GGF41_004844 [Coemansia sp. RSA 2531]|nr:hypothetical protein GGF41_004844 [Coemansia sp. RSA 2531]